MYTGGFSNPGLPFLGASTQLIELLTSYHPEFCIWYFPLSSNNLIQFSKAPVTELRCR
jgi:hypothetical protein